MPRAPVNIIVAEDDEDDFKIIRETLKSLLPGNGLTWVKDGEELLDCLRHHGAFADKPAGNVTPIVLLDLNMPRMDGREALRHIRNDARTKHVPVIVLTTSGAERDIQAMYDLGANSFVRKPDRYDQFVEVIKAIEKYWIETVEVPDGRVTKMRLAADGTSP